ncbi:hypothetical protein MMC18_001972 [Xylographa bjoerkii]|nr:hypothetical protein [Xylographa bjoerkii]
MSADRLVNRAIKSSKVGMLERLQSVTQDQRITLLRFLLVDRTEVRIKTLIDGGGTDFSHFNPSIFAPRPSTDDEARGGSIGNGVLREAAEIFYGENHFVADDAADLLWFVSNIEPNCHGYVKSLILADGVFVRNPNRDSFDLCPEDYQIVNALRRFPGLVHIVFNLTWNFGTIDAYYAGYPMTRFCDPKVCRSLLSINITRVTGAPAFMSQADRTLLLSQDTYLVLAINDRLQEHFWGRQPMLF